MEKQAQLKRLKAAYESEVDHYNSLHNAVLSDLQKINEWIAKIDRARYNDPAQIPELEQFVEVLKEHLENAKKRELDVHTRVIATREAILKLKGKNKQTDIAEGPQNDPRKAHKAVEANAIKAKIADLDELIAKADGTIARIKDSIKYQSDQISKFTKERKTKKVGGEVYKSLTSKISDAKEKMALEKSDVKKAVEQRASLAAQRSGLKKQLAG